MICPTCNEDYNRLGAHFAWNPSHRPDVSDDQRAAIEYLILRGCRIRDDGSEPSLEVRSTSEQFITDIADQLDWLANEPRAIERTDCSPTHSSTTVYGVTTVPHPVFAEYESPTDVTSLHARVARRLIRDAGTWHGLPMGSLHLDMRSYDVSGEHLRRLLRDDGVSPANHRGDGYAKPDSTIRVRYHHDDDVIVVPHYEALTLLETAGLELDDVTPDRPMAMEELVGTAY